MSKHQGGMGRRGVKRRDDVYSEEVKRHFALGLSLEESADRLGISYSAVQYRQQMELSRTQDEIAILAQRGYARTRLFQTSTQWSDSAPPDIGRYATSLRPVPLTEIPPKCCHWPLEPTMTVASHRTLFCADPALEQRPYCERHDRVSLSGAVGGIGVALHPLNIISLCTGGGGLDLGVELALPTARAIVCVEREAFAVATLVEAMRQGLMAPAPIWSDVRSFNGRPWRGLVDGLVGGIPCQPHSLAGKRLAHLDERDLWGPARRIIVQARPWFVLIENVDGFLSSGGGERLWRDLGRLGYARQVGLFSARGVSAPHERKRVFVLGINDSLLADARCPGRPEVARGPSGHEGQDGRQPDCDHIAERADEALADRGSGRRQRLGFPEHGSLERSPRRQSDGCGDGHGGQGALAHAGDERCDQRAGHGAQRQWRTEHQADDRHRGLADTSEPGLARQHPEQPPGSQQPTAERDRRGLVDAEGDRRGEGWPEPSLLWKRQMRSALWQLNSPPPQMAQNSLF